MDISDYQGIPLSYGAGVNSTALAILLIESGWRGEIVFADTGAEWPDTYCFMDYFENEYLKPRGFAIRRIGQADRRDALARRVAGIPEFCEEHAMIPLAASRFCTRLFKIDPCGTVSDKYIIGIAADEAHRQKGRICPLIDWGIGRDECVKVIQDAGLSVPRKSGCWLCMFQTKAQWRELWERYPELYARAEALERASGERRGVVATFDPSGKVTLAQLRLGFESQMDMGFDMDGLREYQPCVCGL